jgi:hypothetical protein
MVTTFEVSYQLPVAHVFTYSHGCELWQSVVVALYNNSTGDIRLKIGATLILSAKHLICYWRHLFISTQTKIMSPIRSRPTHFMPLSKTHVLSPFYVITHSPSGTRIIGGTNIKCFPSWFVDTSKHSKFIVV